MESTKTQSWERREVNGLVDDFRGRGLDVGAGVKPFQWWTLPTFFRREIEVDTWDLKDGDAHHLEGVADRSYNFLFASHILEHLMDPRLALKNWCRVVRPGGVILLAVPHRTLYENRVELPSRWNPKHLRFYLPDKHEPPHTTGLMHWLKSLEEDLGFHTMAVQTGDWGWRPQRGHPIGEYQIDALLHRRLA